MIVGKRSQPSRRSYIYIYIIIVNTGNTIYVISGLTSVTHHREAPW